MEAVDHLWECTHCDIKYYYEHDLEDHQQDEGHYGPKYDCEACDAWFDDYPRVKRHMNQESHWRTHWCNSCQRGFESESNLNAVSTIA
jgi:hypothetical protein